MIVHVLKADVTQVYSNPVYRGFNDHQEFSKTHFEILREKIKAQRRILTHCLLLYFSEVEKYLCGPRTGWFVAMLHLHFYRKRQELKAQTHEKLKEDHRYQVLCSLSEKE